MVCTIRVHCVTERYTKPLETIITDKCFLAVRLFCYLQVVTQSQGNASINNEVMFIHLFVHLG